MGWIPAAVLCMPQWSQRALLPLLLPLLSESVLCSLLPRSVRSFPNFDPNSHVELLMSPSPELVAASLKVTSPSFAKHST